MITIMPVAAYYTWDRLGRPLQPARPIREFVEALRAAYPAVAFSWYADEAHYAAVPAEDHTPYSQTGWPGASPQWYVFATDVMHRPDLGVDCDVLVPYWLTEARAGRMPWLKYLIWQGLLYDVRNDWQPAANSGHFDHAHLSARTDYVGVGLDGWSVVPHESAAHARKAAGMFRLVDPEGGQFVIAPDTLSATGWSWEQIQDPGGVEGWALVAAGIGTANGNLADPNHDPHADNTWRPGSFGPSKSQVRDLLIEDVAARVVESLPPGEGGEGPTLAQIAAAVRTELDATKLTH